MLFLFSKRNTLKLKFTSVEYKMTELPDTEFMLGIYKIIEEYKIPCKIKKLASYLGKFDIEIKFNNEKEKPLFIKEYLKTYGNWMKNIQYNP